MRSLTGAACAPSSTCKALVFNNRVLLKDWTVRIDTVYPSENDPKLVVVYSGTGGNACCWSTDLVDVTKEEPLIIKGLGEGKLTVQMDGLQIEKITGADSIGDQILTTYRYRYGSGRAVTLRETTKSVQSSATGARHPNDVLGDPAIREPLLEAIGRESYANFRRSIIVASPVNVIEGRYLVGEGCKPHECCISQAMFVLDTLQRRGWALRSNSPSCNPGTATAEMWGNLRPEDVIARREFNRWLNEQKIGWSRVSPAMSSPTTTLSPSPPIVATPKAEPRQYRVQMVREGGTYAVPVQINGMLTLNFVVDSGASDVSIPADVFGTLMRTGTVTKDDMIGKAKYTLADGSVKEATTFRIRSLKVGQVSLENVQASVAEAAGPLLLGMSFLGRFPSFSIDTVQHQLVLNR